MIKVLILNLLLILPIYAKVISLAYIDLSKNTLRLGVYSSKHNLNKLIYELNKFDLYIEQINNYTIYLVNIDNINKTTVLNKIRDKYAPDAYFISNNKFQKIIIRNHTLKEDNISTEKKIDVNMSTLITKIHLENNITNIPNKLSEKQIIKVGININKISNIDLTKKNATIDFDIWFKSKKKIDFTKIDFTNAIDKFNFDIKEQIIHDNYIYQRYYFNGKFDINFDDTKFNITKYLIGFKLLSKMTNAQNLEFSVDSEYMDTFNKDDFINAIKEKKIFKDSKWNIRKANFYEEKNNLKTLADPKLSQNNQKIFKISTLNLNIVIDNKNFDSSEYLTLTQASFIMLFSISILISLTVVRKKIYKDKFLKTVSLPQHEKAILDINGAINFETIVSSSQEIERLLMVDEKMTTQQQYVFEIALEMIENILKHSLNSRDIGYHKKETKGSLQIIFDTQSEIYTLKSCNIINENSKFILQEKVNALSKLEDKELRRLSRQKLKHKNDEDTKDSGLGYILLTRRSTKPISIKFEDINDTVIKFILEIKV